MATRYFDENMAHGFSQAFTRYTWEALQTWGGYNTTQIRNLAGNVSRVDYLGGATFGVRYMDHELMTMWLSVDRIPSGLNCMGHKKHKYHPAEQDANIRAFKYFNKYIDNYTGWKFGVNPIWGYDNSLPYDDSQNQAVLNNGLLRPAWYNYIFPGEILITGFINWLSLENYEEH